VPGAFAAALRSARGERSDCRTVRARQSSYADDHQRAVGLLEHRAERMRACCNVGEGLRAGAEVLIRISEVGALADQTDRKAAPAPALADTRVEHSRFPARIRAGDEQCVGLFDSGNCGIEEISRPAPARIERRAVLPAIEVGATEPRQQLLEREDLLDCGKIAGDRANSFGLSLLQLGGDDIEGVRPGCRMKLAVLTNIGLIKPLRA